MTSTTEHAPIEFVIAGMPKPKSNQKVIAKRPDGSWKVMNDTSTRAAENDFAGQSAAHAPRTPWECPLRLEVMYVFPVPWSWPDWQKIAGLKGEYRHVSAPDLENCSKLIKDAMQGLFYKNDSQVCEESVKKRYGMEEETRVRLIPLAQAKKPVGAKGTKNLSEIEARQIYEEHKGGI